ncbi:hypothetical protein [Roseovarius nanhaiticus]|uniref:hypothetical protein n=1 Tax=Roseovarius nanhaiticus TaxID=573024 RepID=UPI00249025DE|nr:hypothetical protein [Roseovarius nanhaiticus]
MPRNRSLPPYLEIRKSGYFWRRRLPRSLRDRGGQSSGAPEDEISKISKKIFLCFSLRIHVLRDAKILARRLTEMSDLVFAADAEMTMAIASETQVQLLESLARFEIEAFERGRAVAGPRSSELAAHELRREEALQTTLRQAIYLGDRESVRHPLRHVAEKLGVDLDESDPDWVALAYEATKTLLDVSQERARRQQGIYDQPTLFFRRAVSPNQPASLPPSIATTGLTVPPAGFATSADAPAPAVSAPASHGSTMIAAAVTASPTVAQNPSPAQEQDVPSPSEPPAHAPSMSNTTSLTRVIVPAGLDCPEGWDEAQWQEARIAARPPRILIDKSLLSEDSRAALAKPRGIGLVEAIDLFFELRSLGYSAPFDRHQKRKKTRNGQIGETLVSRLPLDLQSKYRLARDFWPAALGDQPVDEIPVDDVNDALCLFWGAPASHNKSQTDRGKYNLVELIEMADAEEAQLERDIEVAKACGAGSEEIDKMRMEGHMSRISVTTFIKHGRILRAVGDMLMNMQLIDQNPFSICTWSNKDVTELQSTEGERKRQAWDDRINDLWRSRIFQEPLKDIGDPLFWAPLIARLQGMRMEEILQLGPDDFGEDKGVPYLTIRHTIINGVKTLSSARTLPIHPQLIQLGLLKLVALRKKNGHIRLFPFLNRGKQKDTFSANFSKAFGYYRRTNACYWPGLDFHALRTTFHHDLLGDDKSDAIRCRLMGHTYTDEGDRSYGQNLGIETLATRMKSVVVDISMIRNPFKKDPNTILHRGRDLGLRVVG